MKFLKNTKFAAAALAIVLVGSLFAGTNISIIRSADKLEKLYYEGMEAIDGNYTRPSLASQADACMDYAMGLYTVSGNYDDDEEIALWRNRLSHVRSSYKNADKPSYYSSAYHGTLEAAEQLYDALQIRANMSERDAEAVGAYYTDLTGAKALIISLADEYNAEVTSAMNAADSFPAGILSGNNARQSLRLIAFPTDWETTWYEDSWSSSLEDLKY